MRTSLVVMMMLLVAGCSTTPISDAGYKRSDRYYHSGTYPGELDEMSILGIRSMHPLDSNDLVGYPVRTEAFHLTKDSHLLLLQSGARFPDSEMVSSLSEYWSVATLSGEPQQYDGLDLNKTLRYAAASGGNDYVVVYWGVVESAQKNAATKTVSWVPLIGWVVPDETVNMRIVLRFALIDVATGQWKTFQPEPVEEQYLSAMISRESKTQIKELELKKLVYRQAAEQLHRRFSVGVL